MYISRLSKQICHELSPSYQSYLTTKKLIVSIEYSAVNFIVEWKLFNLLRNFSRDFSCSQIKKMSSMYLHHIIGFPSKALRIFSSKSAINKITYGGANFVPISIPCTCLKFFHPIQDWKHEVQDNLFCFLFV